MPNSTPQPSAPPPPRVVGTIIEAADAAAITIVVARLHEGEVQLLYINQGCQRMLGWTRSDLTNQPLWDFIEEDERDRLRDLNTRSLRGERVPSVVETRLLHKDGRRIPVEISATRVDLNGDPGMVVFCFDIGYRKQAEEALRSSEVRFRSLIENAPDGVAILRWPRIQFVNPAAARLLGYESADAAVGCDIRDALTPADREPAQPMPPGAANHVERQLEVGFDAEPRQYHCEDADSRERTVEISAIPIEYEGQAAVLAFARDVTARNLMASKLLEADKLAAVGTLAAGVAHEINNPLAYLMLNLEVLSRELPRLADDPGRLESVQKRLEDIRQGAERVKTIVRDLQTFTRRDEEMRGPVDLPGVVEHAIHMAQHEIRHRAQLVTTFETVPAVYGNATRLEQLFLNLLVNAAHALDDGDPDRDVIEVKVAEAPDGMVAVEVRDTGCGMAEHVRRKAFEPFFTTKPPGVGTGLGLPICRGIVDALGGDIIVMSKPKVGTTARVLLRAVESRQSRPPAASEPPGRITPNTPPGRILLVDDDVAVAESLACAIREHHEVHVANTVPDARAAIAEHQFDAVLCDLVMPGETGMDLFEGVVRERPELAKRFIFMTGGAFLPRAEKFLEVVDNPRIDKPFELSALSRLLERVMLAE